MFVFVQGSWFEAVNHLFSFLFFLFLFLFLNLNRRFLQRRFPANGVSGVDLWTALCSFSSSYMLCVVSLRWSNPMSYRVSAPSTLCLRWLCLTFSSFPSAMACGDRARHPLASSSLIIAPVCSLLPRWAQSLLSSVGPRRCHNSTVAAAKKCSCKSHVCCCKTRICSSQWTFCSNYFCSMPVNK